MLGENLRIYREKAGVSKTELANAIGVTPSVIIKYERGICNPNVQGLRLISNWLGISMDMLCDNLQLYPGGALRVLREAAKVSRSRAARELGIKAAQYAEMENGVRPVHDLQVEALLGLFGCSKAQLDNAVPLYRELKVVRLEQRLMEKWQAASYEQRKKMVELLEVMVEEQEGY